MFLGNVHGLTIAGLLLVLLGTWFTIKGQQIINDKTSVELQNKAKRIEELSEKNIKLTEENKNLVLESTAIVTGGDSYCYILPTPGIGINNSNSVNFHLTHEGKYPVYDIEVRIDDSDEVGRILKEEQTVTKFNEEPLVKSMSRLSKASKTFPIGNLSPTRGRLLGLDATLPSNADKKSYFVSITSRNSYIEQNITYHRVEGEWKLAYKVMRNNKMVREFVEDGFPKNSKGEIEW